MRGLTQRQSEILDFLKSHLAATGTPPCFREVASHFGWTSTSAVACHFRAIKRKGFIRIAWGQSRAITILGARPEAVPSHKVIYRGECFDCGAALFGVSVCPMCAVGKRMAS